jgi:thioesterase domain-containing protein/acyl carrier protein
MRDLGYRLPDGRIAHAGRKDAQVKIRGHRVEIGEVELALLQVPEVKEAAVTVQDTANGEKRLIGHIVKKANASLPDGQLRASLKEKVPAYMLPAQFVAHDALPLTTSGKVDRVKLAESPLPSAERSRVAPRDHLETHLLEIWKEVLDTDGFGIRDEFYELGGDSLRAVKVVMRIQEVFGREIELGNLAKELTIEKLADVLHAEEHENLERPIVEIQRGGDRLPIVFCHGDFISGGLFCRNLARHIGPDQPFYAIPPHGLNGAPLPASIEAMAADRVEAVLNALPAGPVAIGGFCWGGFVALELARLLQARGVVVPVVFAIDSDPKHLDLRPVRRLIRAAARIARVDDETERRWFRKVRWSVDGLRQREGFSARLQFVGEKVRNHFSRGPEEPKDGSARALAGSPVSALDRHDRWTTFHRINQDYVAEPYGGRVVLFRSSRLQLRHPNDPLAGWRYISPSIETRDIAGDHWTCVTTHVVDVAQKIAASL